MEDHLIFFIDILGFSHAVQTWDDEKLNQLTNLLHELASWQSNASCEEINCQETPNGELGVANPNEIEVRPAITTFSDNIVISYPIQMLHDRFGDCWLSLLLAMIGDRIGWFSAQVLRLDLLIRGGVTIGPLYHVNGVVIGKAMVEAYRFESKVSNYPRISVSQKVYSQIPIHDYRILEDIDGVKHFNYFNSMLQKAVCKGEDYLLRMQDFITQSRQIITNNIARFENDQYWNERAKWVWFSRQFEKCASEYEFVFKE